MRHHASHAVALAIALAPAMGHAQLVVDRSLTVSATGDLALSGPSLTSSLIQPAAGGSLSLGGNNSAPSRVQLIPGELSLGPNLTPITGAGILNSTPGAVWVVGLSAVPEPSVGLLGLAGLGMLGCWHRRRQRHAV